MPINPQQQQGDNMKKLLTIAAFSFLIMPATPAFSFDALTALTTTKGAVLGFTPSNSVTLYYANDMVSGTSSGGAAGASSQWYVATAKHTGGDRAYGTTAKTNLLVTPRHDDCVGADSVTCAAALTTPATVLTASGYGQSNVDALTGWTVL